MEDRPRSTSALGRVLALLAIAALVALALIIASRPSETDVTARPSATPTQSPTAPTSTAPPASAASASSGAASGTIAGRLGYPSDFVPPLTVYAISTRDSSVWFSTNTPLFANPGVTVSPSPGAPPSPTWPPSGPGMYLITGVSPGTYYVIAYRNDSSPQSPYPGAYTERGARCLSLQPDGSTPPPGPCPYPQTLLPVTVSAGQAVTNIHVVDWLFQGATYPPRPTPR